MALRRRAWAPASLSTAHPLLASCLSAAAMATGCTMPVPTLHDPRQLREASGSAVHPGWTARTPLRLSPAACRAPRSPSSPGLASHPQEPSRGWSPPSHSHCARPHLLARADSAKGPRSSTPGDSILVPTRLKSTLSHFGHARRSLSPHSVPPGTQLCSLTWILGPQPRA